MAAKKGIFGWLSAEKKESDEEKGEEPRMKEATFNLPKFRIKYKGVFDLDALYRGSANWFKERKYELNETLYKSKPPELELNWKGVRKKTGFYKEVIEVHFHLFETRPVEVIEKGIKKQYADATMTITIWGAVETDYEDIFGESKWRDSSLKRKLLDFYNKHIVKLELDTMQVDVLYYEMYNLQTLMKKLIGMKTTGSAYGSVI